MKSKKALITNLILLTLAFAISLSFCACSSDTDESSSVQSETSETTSSLTISEALALLNNDRRIIEIFACNSLSSSESAVGYVPLADSHELYGFAKIRELLSSAYAVGNGEIESFLAYPIAEYPSVRDVDGVTNVFFHKGIGFEDFIDTDTVALTVHDSKTEIKAKTLSGKDVTLNAVYENGKWLLEKSLLSVLDTDDSFEEKPPLSGLGSLSEFSGNVLVINFFVSDVNYKFTSDEEKEFASRVSTAVDYLVEEAERLGGEVNVTYENAYFEHIGNIGNGDLAFDIVFSETGFGTLSNFAERHFENLSEYDNYFFAVCFNKECEPLFKANDGEDTTEVHKGERLFVGSNTTKEDIARMTLQLAGAGNYRFGDYTEELYYTYFPNDVFSDCPLVESALSPVTAYSCGIINELPELYRYFIYNQDNQEQSEEE